MSSGEAIAIVGLACRFPGAPSAEQFWRNLRDGVESITFFTDDELRAAGADPSQARFVGAKGVLDQADCFDAGFFGVRSWRGPRNCKIFAVWPMTSRPALRNGGAKGGRATPRPPRKLNNAGTPAPLPDRRATSSGV